MILAAALLVLVGLALFVAGILTSLTALYWLCVAACGLAAVLLLASRVRTARATAAEPGPADESAPGTQEAPASTAPAVTTPPSTAPQPAVGRVAPPATARQPAVERIAPPPSTPAPSTAPQPAVEPVPPPTAPPTAPPVAPPVAAAEPPSTAAHAARGAAGGAHAAPSTKGEPPVEEVEVTDLLLVVDLHDEVLVVDEHPRYHLAGCRALTGRETFPLPVDEARTDGFSPCGWCAPDRNLARRERTRRAGPA